MQSSTSVNHGTPAQQVLAMPEILHLIFHYLGNDMSLPWTSYSYGHRPPGSVVVTKKSLYSAILVNHTWAGEALNTLWRNSTDLALSCVSEDRRQFYANKVRSLHLQQDFDDGALASASLTFPQLRAVCVQEHLDEHILEKYMVPNLQSFTSNWGVANSNGVLDLLTTRCQGLREVSLIIENATHDTSSQRKLLNFFAGCRRLESIRLWLELDHDVSLSELLIQLASQEHLQSLDLVYTEIQDTQLSEALQSSEVKSLFQQLRHLTIVLEPSPFLFLASHLSSLTSFNLRLHGYHSPDDLLALSKLTCLRTLTLYLSRGFFKEDLVHMGTLHRMQNLKLEAGRIAVTSIDENDIASFLSKFPNMKTLRFDPFSRTGLPTSAIVVLGRASPLLEVCELTCTTWNMRSLMTAEAPLFPRLRRLELKNATDGVDSLANGSDASTLDRKRSEELVKGILTQCPRLEGLKIAREASNLWREVGQSMARSLRHGTGTNWLVDTQS